MLWSIFAMILAMIGVAVAVAPVIPGLPANRITRIGIGVFLVVIAILIIANDYSWAVMMR